MYFKKSVVAKAEDSHAVDVVAQGMANMSMSFQPPEGDTAVEPDEQAQGSPSDSGVDVSIEKKTKKKRTRKGKKNQPTGFEQNYAEAPVTPAEFHEEAVDLYNPRSFNERIETCIQRYRARRKMNSEISDYFDHYLILGGVNSGKKMFSGGVDFAKGCELDSEQIATLRATDYVHEDKNDIGRDSSWVVDWEGIAKGFFSDYAPEKWDLSRVGRIDTIINVVDNFLRYVLHHNVCPEFTDQIEAARKVCIAAKTELPLTIQASQRFPGQFGQACSVLFGGRHSEIHEANFEQSLPVVSFTNMSKETALKVFKVGMSILGNAEQIEMAAKPEAVILKIEENVLLEIKEIEKSSKETRAYYEQLDQSLSRLGKLICCEWEAPFKAPEDLTDEELAAQEKEPSLETYEFWVDDEVFDSCKVGMKLNASIGILAGGKFQFIDHVNVLHCSFYTYLMNRQLEDWVTPRPWNRKTNSISDEEEEAHGDAERDDGTAVGENKE